MKWTPLVLISVTLFLLFINPINALDQEQKQFLEKTITAIGNDKQNLIRLLDLLDRNKIDLSDEPELATQIRQLATSLGINTNKYSNINGLNINSITAETQKTKNKFNPLVVITSLIAFSSLLIYELFKINKIDITEIKEEYTDEVIQELDTYIKDAFKKGYSKEEVRKLLLDNNWKEYAVDEALKNLTISPKSIDKNVDDGLSKYIKDAFKKGYSKEEVRKLLLNNNWKRSDVDKSLNQFP